MLLRWVLALLSGSGGDSGALAPRRARGPIGLQMNGKDSDHQRRRCRQKPRGERRVIARWRRARHPATIIVPGPGFLRSLTRRRIELALGASRAHSEWKTLRGTECNKRSDRVVAARIVAESQALQNSTPDRRLEAQAQLKKALDAGIDLTLWIHIWARFNTTRRTFRFIGGSQESTAVRWALKTARGQERLSSSTGDADGVVYPAI